MMNEMIVPEVMELAGERVLTTKIIAEMYGTAEKVVRENFRRNIDRYTEGKHFYLLKGEDLKEFAHLYLRSTKARTLYLWTEKGALLHAKSLNTDKAWEVYDFLIENYLQISAVMMACYDEHEEEEKANAEAFALLDTPHKSWEVKCHD